MPVAVRHVSLVPMDLISSVLTPGEDPDCPVCDRTTVVLVALRHPTMRRWSDELLTTEHGFWSVVQPGGEELLVDAIARTSPDLVVVDDADLPTCCKAALEAFAPDRVIVVGPEPDESYRLRALAQGAGGWLCRERIAEELSVAMRAALGCRHDPCPPDTPVRPAVLSAGTVQSPDVSTGGGGLA